VSFRVSRTNESLTKRFELIPERVALCYSQRVLLAQRDKTLFHTMKALLWWGNSTVRHKSGWTKAGAEARTHTRTEVDVLSERLG
jgi:hypothetical protein